MITPMLLQFSYYGLHVWGFFLLFSFGVWLTFLALRFWVRLFKRMSFFDDSD